MNILFVTHYSDLYGANLSLLQLIKELKQNYGVSPFVLLPNRGVFCEKLDAENIPYMVSHYYWWVNDNNGIFQWALNWRKQIVNFLRLKKINKMLDIYSIDLVYSNSITINIGSLLARKLHCPHIWHIRETLESYGFKLSIGKCLSKMFLKKGADKYILISDYVIQSYKHLLPIERVEKVYNGIDFTSRNVRLNVVNQHINLCIAGILSEQKNILDAIKALKVLRDEYNVNNIQLHIIGRGKDDYLAMLKNYVSNNELESCVLFYGHLDNIHDFLSTMNIGLMCSRDEAFGRVSIEFMMHSMPVIASKSGANSEIVNEKCGLIYSLYDELDLAEKIYRFIRTPELISSIGQQAFLYAKENFSSEKNTLQIYKYIKIL